MISNPARNQWLCGFCGGTPNDHSWACRRYQNNDFRYKKNNSNESHIPIILLPLYFYIIVVIYFLKFLWFIVKSLLKCILNYFHIFEKIQTFADTKLANHEMSKKWKRLEIIIDYVIRCTLSYIVFVIIIAAILGSKGNNIHLFCFTCVYISVCYLVF